MDPDDLRAENATLHHALRRQRGILTRLTDIQRAISERAELQDVLDAIIDAAHEMLGDEQLGLFLLDEENPSELQLVACRGVDDDLLPDVMRRPVGEGVAGRAFAEDQLVVVEDYAAQPEGTLLNFRVRGLAAAMAAPVHENGRVIGSLLVSSYRHRRRYSRVERDVLIALAEHTSLALNDARVVAEMTHQALHDPLTALPNRALFADRLHQARERARRRGGHVAVLFCDLDRFKTINDSLGHAAGDELLCGVAERIRACLRGEDTAARLGGDEFAVLLEDMTDVQEALAVADRILASLRRPFLLQGREVYANASVGVATASGRQGGDLLRRADVAMYRAKEEGRGRAVLYAPAMQEAAVERLELEADLEHALERGELEVYYQPIVELRTGALRGFEALARWRHPVRGLLGAPQFIPLAEDTGRLPAIGRFVLREACSAFVRWRAMCPDAGLDLMSVNLSVGELAAEGLQAEVSAVLAETGLPPECLMVEITEGSLVSDNDPTVDHLHDLRNLGVELAVDDFGTGYSALRYLSALPIGVLKMAKPFVDDLERGGRGAALAGGIVDMAGNLELRVVAEGIEHASQAARLRALGCALGQGYHFARPMPEADVDRALREPPEDATWRLGPVDLAEQGLVRLV